MRGCEWLEPKLATGLFYGESRESSDDIENGNVESPVDVVVF